MDRHKPKPTLLETTSEGMVGRADAIQLALILAVAMLIVGSPMSVRQHREVLARLLELLHPFADLVSFPPDSG